MLRESETENLICQAVLKLMQQKSYMNITVKDIVTTANVGRSTFYLYFNSKYDVIQKIEDTFIDDLIEMSDSYRGKYPESITYKTLSYIQDHMDVFRALSGPYGDPYFQSRFERAFSDIFERRPTRVSGTRISEAELRLLYEQIAGGRWAMYKWWAFHEDAISIDEVVKLIQQINVQIYSLMF